MGKFPSKAGASAPAPKAAANANSGGKNITLLDIREIVTKKGKANKIQLSKGVQIYFEGQPVDFGEYNSAFIKDKAELLTSLEFLVEKEYMSEEEAEKKAAFYDEKGIILSLTVKI